MTGGHILSYRGARKERRRFSKRVDALLRLTMIGTALSGSWPVGAQVAPGGAHAPTMDAASNGTRIVKINTPNAKGASLNTYSDFNVGPAGLILNNSPSITSTQLAGYIDGNDALKAGGPASLIINQVVGARPSSLQGYLEVAGNAAQVVVANSNGISCAGCGFINSPWATLTTGAPKLDATGALAGYGVERGSISIEGQGLDASGMRLDLFARAIAINAGIWADTVNAVTGGSDIATGAQSSDEIVVAARTAAADETAPRFALDVAALGGMYAKSIRLVGTEAGLGVNVDGTLASLEKDFTLTAAGGISLAGKVIAAGAAHVQSAGPVAVSGQIYSDGSAEIVSDAALTNGGLISSGGDLAVRAGAITSTGILAAGLHRDGSWAGAGDLTISGATMVALQGQTVAPGSLLISGGTIDLASGAVQSGGAATLAATAIAQAERGQLLAAGALSITGALSNAGMLQGARIALAGNSVLNSGVLLSTGALSIDDTGAVTNSGTIESADVTRIVAGSIDNSGRVANLSATGLSVRTTGAVVNRGRLGGNGDVDIEALSIDTRSGGLLTAGGSASIKAAAGIDVSQSGSLVSGGALSVIASALDNHGGGAIVGDTVALTADSLVNDAGLVRASGAGDSTITVSSTLSNRGGTIFANGQNLSISAGALANAGGTIAHTGTEVLGVAVGGAIDNSALGQIATNAALRLTGASVDNRGGLLSSGGDTAIDLSRGVMVNDRGTVQAGKGLVVTSASLTNRGGAIVALGDKSLTLAVAGAIDGRDGQIGGNGDVTIASASADLGGSAAKTSSSGNLAITSTGALALDGGAVIDSNGDTTLIAGTALSGQASSFNVGQSLSFRAGALSLDEARVTAAAFGFDAGSISLKNTAIQQSGTADFTLISAGGLDYSGATLLSGGTNFTIRAASLTNDGGQLLHSGTGLFTIDVGGTVSNAGGTIATNGALALQAASLDNSAGTISAIGNMRFAVNDLLANDAGTILAGGALTLGASHVANSSGIIEAAGALVVTATSLTGDAGQILSTNSSLELLVQDGIAMRGGTVAAKEEAIIRAATIDIGGGGILSAGGALGITATAGGIQADTATIVGNALTIAGAAGLVTDGARVHGRTVMIDVGALSNVAGEIIGDDTSALTVAGGVTNAGTITVNAGDLMVDAGSLMNGAGTIGNAGTGTLAMTIHGAVSNDVGGIIIIGEGALSLRAGALTNAGFVSGQSATSINVDGTLFNSGVIASPAALTVSAGSIRNDGQIVATGPSSLAVTATGTLTGQGQIGGNGDVTVRAGSVSLDQATLSAVGRLDAATTAGDFSLAGGIVTGGTLKLGSAGTLAAGNGTQITTAGAATIMATTVSLDSASGAMPTLLNAATLDLTATDLSVTHGAQLQVAGAGDLTVRLSGTLDISGGIFSANADNLSISAATIVNTGGVLSHNGQGILALTVPRITNSGTISTQGGLSLSGDTLANSGTISAIGNGSLFAGTALSNSGTIVAGGVLEVGGGAIGSAGGLLSGLSGLTIRAASLDASGGQLLAGRLSAPGDVSALSITTTGAINAAGATLAATGDATLTASAIDLTRSGRLTGRAVSATAASGDIAAGQIDGVDLTLSASGAITGTLIASSRATLEASLLDISGAKLSAGALDATLGSLRNIGGAISVTGGDPLRIMVAGAIDNTDGRVETNATDFTLTGGSLTNTGGTIAHAGTGLLTVTTTGTIDNNGGMIGANGLLALNAASLTNGGGTIRAAGTGPSSVTISGQLSNGGLLQADGGPLTISAASLANGAGTIGTVTGALTVTVAGAASNDAGGVIASNDALTFNARAVTNAGSITARGPLKIGAIAGALTNSGEIGGQGAVDVTAGSIDISGRIIASGADTLKIVTTGVLVAGGTIGGNGDVVIEAGSATFSGAALNALGTLDVTAKVGNLALTGGTLAGAALNLGTTGTLSASGGATITTGGTATVTADTLRLTGAGGGTPTAFKAGTLALAATHLAVTDGAQLGISGTGPLALSVGGSIDLSGGILETNAADLTIDTGRFTAIGGTLLHHGTGALSLTASSFDSSAAISTNGAFVLASTTATNSGSITAAGNGTLTIAGSLANSGSIVAGGSLTVDGGAIGSTGTLAGVQGLSIDVASLDASNGRLLAGQFSAADDARSLNITVSGALVAKGGLIASTGDAVLRASAIDLTSGGRLTGRAVNATAIVGDLGGGQIDGANLALSAAGTVSGSMLASSSLTVIAGTLDTSNAVLSTPTLAVSIGALRNAHGSITVTGSGPLTIAASGAIDNNSGVIQTNAGNVTLSGSSIGNIGGSIATSGAGLLTLTSGSAFDNSNGTIAANGAFALTSVSLTNDGGSLTAPGASTITVVDTLSNRGGTLSSDAGLTIDPSGIDNGNGVIASSGGPLSIIAGSLDNRGGVIGGGRANGAPVAAGGALTLAITNSLDNSNGTIATNQGLTLQAGSLTNAGGLVTAVQGADVRLSSLANGGEISAGQALGVTVTGAADNAGGVLSGKTLELHAASFANGSGQAIGTDSATFTIGGLFDNGTGKSGSSGAVTLRAVTLSNAGTIAGDTLDLAITGAVSNGAGASIWADRDATLSAASVTNASSIAAGHDLTLSALMIDNGAGTLGGGNRLDLSFTNATLGNLAALNDLALTVNNDWSLGAGQTFGSAHNLTLTVHGSLANAGILQANGNATISVAGAVTNAAGAAIRAGALTLSSGGQLSNDGLINANGAASMSVGSLSNRGQIFGNSVSINAAGDISNAGSPAVIATRSGELAIHTSGSVINSDGAMLYALGNLTIDGRDGSGRAAGLTNSSATIQASGDIAIAANAIVNTRSNTNSHVETWTEIVTNNYSTLPGNGGVLSEELTRTITQEVLDSSASAGLIVAQGSIRFNGDSLENRYSTISAAGAISFSGGDLSSTSSTSASGGFQNFSLVGTRTTVESGEREEWFGCPNACDTRTRTIRPTTTTETVVIAPGIVFAGGGLSIDAYNVDNALLDANGQPVFGFSRTVTTRNTSVTMSGGLALLGDVSGSGASLAPNGVSASVTGGSVVAGSGGTRASGQLASLGAGGAQGSASGQTAGGIPPTGAQAIAGNSVGGSGAATAIGLAGANIDTATGATGAGLTDAVFTRIKDGIPADGFSPLTGRGGTPTGSAAPAPGTITGLTPQAASAFRIGLGGLFAFATPGSHYLIETNPAFTDQQTFLSSDYFLDRLGYDPTRMQTRLGDALYEQQLVSQQLTSLTGNVLLAGYSDNQDQYRALLDAGADYMQRFDLALGVGLTAEQMASLTTDIVLLVNVTVQTPSGPQTALAPMVYLASVHAGDVQTSGALIASGGTLTIRTTDGLTNAGVIKASLGSDIRAGGTIVNDGTIAGGKVATISAGQDLVSNGGTISGGDLTMSAGGTIALNAVETTSHIATRYVGGNALTDTVTHQVAAVDATGKLTLVALGDVTTQGAQLSAGSSATVWAGGNVTLGAVTDTSATSFSEKIGKTRTTGTVTDETVTGTSLTGSGGVSVAAGLSDATGKLTITAGTIGSANGAVELSGAGGVVIGTANEHDTSDITSVTKKSGLLSSKKTTTTDSVTTDTAIGSTISGNTVTIASSAGGISVTGSNVVASNGISLAAKGDVEIGAATSTASEDTAYSVKKSGLSIGGGGLFLGSAKLKSAGSASESTSTGSIIASAQGPITIEAGKSLMVAGSLIATSGDVKLAGDTVTIVNATNTADSSSHSKSSSFGLSIGGYENVSAAANSLGGLAGRIDDAAAGGAAQTGVTAASETIRTVRSVMTAATNAAGLSASIGFSKSQSDSTTHVTEAVGSGITGDHVSVIARAGDLSVTGSSITGASSVDLAAARDVLLQSAQNTQNTSNSSSSSGASLGVSVGVGLAGSKNVSASIGVNASNAKGSAASVTQVNTVIDGGQQLTITSGRDTMLVGADASARDVTVDAGRNLTVASVQDTASGSNHASGIGLGVSYSPGTGFGGNASLSGSKGSSHSEVVESQSAILAEGGALTVHVGDTTTLAGGVLGAVDVSGKDSGRLTLDTGHLQVSDIEDGASSRDISLGLSASLNDPTKKGEANKGNFPVASGGYQSATFAQETRGTLGAGSVTVRDTAGSTDLASVNRDLSATQVVTADSKSGFTLYVDPAATREAAALATGDAQHSVILSTAGALAQDPLGAAKAVIAEIGALGDHKPNSGQIDALLGAAHELLVGTQRAAESDARTVAGDPRFQGAQPDAIAALRDGDAIAAVRRTYGDAAADQFAALLQTPEGRAISLAAAQVIAGYQVTGGDLDGVKGGLVAGSPTPTASGRPEESTVTAHQRTWGDSAVTALAGAGKLINSLPPTVQQIAQAGLAALLDGPVAAVGGYFIGKAVEKGIENSPNAQQAIRDAGLLGISALSSDSLTRNTDDASARSDYSEGNNLLTAAGTLLSIAPITKLLGETGALKGAKPPIWTSTGSKTGVQNAYGHWKKHGTEFPEFANSKQYVEGAYSYVTSPPAGTLTKSRPNGDTLFYNLKTNTFAVRAADGSPRTMFRPKTGINYWNAQ